MLRRLKRLKVNDESVLTLCESGTSLTRKVRLGLCKFARCSCRYFIARKADGKTNAEKSVVVRETPLVRKRLSCKRATYATKVGEKRSREEETVSQQFS